MNIKKLKELIKDFDNDLNVVVSDDYGWDNIYSVDSEEGVVYLNTESSDFTLGKERIL